MKAKMGTGPYVAALHDVEAQHMPRVIVDGKKIFLSGVHPQRGHGIVSESLCFEELGLTI
jgi:hypothetical protein